MTTLGGNETPSPSSRTPATSSRLPSYLNSLDKLVTAGLPRFGGGVLFGTAATPSAITGPTPNKSSSNNNNNNNNNNHSSSASTTERNEPANMEQTTLPPVVASMPSSAELVSPNLSENGSNPSSNLVRKRSGATAAARARARARLRWPTSFEDLHQLFSVEYQFVRGRSLTSTGRVLLKEGYLLKEAPGKAPSMRKFFLFSDILICGAPIKSNQRKVRSSVLSITPTGSDTVLATSTPTSTAELAKVAVKGSISTEHLLATSVPLTSSSSSSSSLPQHIQFVEADTLKSSKSLDKGTTHHLMPPTLDTTGSCSLSRSSSIGQTSSHGGSQTMSNTCTPLFERQIVISLGSINVNLVKDNDLAISITKGKESFTIRTRDIAEKEEWYKSFCDALTGYRELQARRAREQTPDPVVGIRRTGLAGATRHPTHRSRTMDEGFRRSWAGSTVSSALSSMNTTKSPLSMEAINSINHNSNGHAISHSHTHSSDLKMHSNERSSGIYDSLRFWQVPRALQRKDSMSSDISRQSDLDGVSWVPDDMVDTCMVCKKIKFGMMVRKHHCRRCGFVICWNCSEMRKSTSQPERKVRTCIDCIATCDGTGWMTVEYQEDRQPSQSTPQTQSPEEERDLPPMLVDTTKLSSVSVDSQKSDTIVTTITATTNNDNDDELPSPNSSHDMLLNSNDDIATIASIKSAITP